MSIRLASTQLLAPGILLSRYAGHGVRGDAIPATGTHGPAPLYAWLTLPADAANEYRWTVTTAPAVGDLVIFEDGSYSYTPPPATVDLLESFDFDAWENGAYLGEATHTITIGSPSVVGDQSLAWVLRSAVQQDAGLTWVLRSAVQQDAGLAWSVLNAGQVISDLSLAWFLRSAVQADSTQAWTLRSAVQRDSLQSWLAYQSVIANRDLAWAIGAVDSVISDASLAWTMRATVTRDRSLSWAVGASVVPPVIRLKVTFTKIPTFITRTAR